MKSVIRPELWLAVYLLMTLIENATGQVSQPQNNPDQPELQLPALLTAKPLIEDPNDDDLRKLLKARYNEAVRESKALYEWRDVANRFGVSLSSDPDGFYGPWHRLLRAGLELYDEPAERIALLEQYVEIMRQAERTEQARYDAGRIPIMILHRARYERLDAQIRLLHAKREAEKAKGK